jgi:hypothetical protein
MGDVFVGDDDVAANVDGYGALPLSEVRARTLHVQAAHRALRCIAPELPSSRCSLARRAPHCALCPLCTLGCCMVASIKTSIACPTPFPVRAKFPRPKQKCAHALHSRATPRAMPHVRAPPPRAAPSARRVILCILSVLCS